MKSKNYNEIKNEVFERIIDGAKIAKSDLPDKFNRKTVSLECNSIDHAPRNRIIVK